MRTRRFAHSAVTIATSIIIVACLAVIPLNVRAKGRPRPLYSPFRQHKLSYFPRISPLHLVPASIHDPLFNTLCSFLRLWIEQFPISYLIPPIVAVLLWLTSRSVDDSRKQPDFADTSILGARGTKCTEAENRARIEAGNNYTSIDQYRRLSYI